MKMTHNQVLRILILHARRNGFEFRQWFCSHIQTEWPGSEAAVTILCDGSRYYALLFSHEFANCFWKQGTQISFLVPSVSYTRKNDEGKIITVSRKPFTRRTLKADVWRYHLREMAAADDPLLYIRRFLPMQEDVLSVEDKVGRSQRAAAAK